MNIMNFSSYEDFILYRLELVSDIYEIEKLIKKKKENICLEYDFLERKDRIKFGDDSKHNYWVNSKNIYLKEWEKSLRDNINIDDLKTILDEVNRVLYDLDMMRFMSNRECLSILLNVLNRDDLEYEVKFYDVGNETLVCLVSSEKNISKKKYILYDRCFNIQDKRNYLNQDHYLYYDYFGMNEEDMKKVNNYIFNRYKKNRCLLRVKKKKNS